MDESSGLFTAKGRLLVEVMDKPGITINELADNLFLTRRTVWGYVGELRRMGYLRIKKRGKTHHYFITSLALLDLRKLIVDRGTGAW